jgi:hypothetical protein
MANREYKVRVATDEDHAPLTEGELRRNRISELLKASEFVRPGRRQGDPLLLKQIQDELTMLMDAELLWMQQEQTERVR